MILSPAPHLISHPSVVTSMYPHAEAWPGLWDQARDIVSEHWSQAGACLSAQCYVRKQVGAGAGAGHRESATPEPEQGASPSLVSNSLGNLE